MERENNNHKGVEGPLRIWDGAEFKTRCLGEERGTFHDDKGSAHQEDATAKLCVHPARALRYGGGYQQN